MRGKPNSKEQNRKISESHKGMVFSAEHRRNISRAQKKRFANPEERAKIRASLLRGMATQARMGMTGASSSIERLLQDELDRRQIRYEIHVPIEDIGIPDIVFQEQRVLVEADGDYWHRLPHAVQRDAKQNAAYTELDYAILRFWGSEIRESPAECVDKIVKVLNSRKAT